MIWTVLLSIGLFCVLLALLMTAVNLRFYRRPGAAEATESVTVSVCIPARNEEANIAACVESLLAGSHTKVQVLVYNDQSTDRTGEIVGQLATRDQRVRSVATVPLPEGWNGKQWGCHRMAAEATGEWLLFTDADVRFGPECLARSLAEAHRLNADLVSTFPRQVTGSLGEALLIPLIHFILLSYLPFVRMRRTGDPAASAGCGQFLLVRREAYRASGGHAEFSSSMHDGIRLPRALRAKGFRTDLFDGTELVSCRMYRGIRQTWRGFAKNAFEGLGSVALLVVVTVIHLLGHVLPAGYLVWWTAGGNVSQMGVGIAAAAVTLSLAHRLWLAVWFRQSFVGAVLHPLGIVMMTAIQWHSLVLAKTGRRAWKGRVQTA